MLCNYCFNVIEADLNETDHPKFPEEIKDEEYPIFVTWYMDGDLRGCIGTFSPDKLSSVLPRYTIIAAMEDDRFTPITKAELPKLSVGISLLTNFETIDSPTDWEVGTHGIEIDFKKHGRYYGATFLPEVAAEENWDVETTLNYLVRKGGYNGNYDTIKEDEWKQIKRYQSLKFEMKYSDKE